MNSDWHLRLFRKSVIKQRKWKEIASFLGDTRGCRCLDIGSDNGVISYLLRQRGGNWSSADLDSLSVNSIRALVETEVYEIDGGRTPFNENEFDKIVIVDFLEHIQHDKDFVAELHRIMRPGGELIVNVPHLKVSLLNKVRSLLGQTDEKHGHVRAGYTLDELRDLLENMFLILSYKTYSRFFSELIDMVIRTGYELLKKTEAGGTASEYSKGALVTELDIAKYKKSYRLFSIIYPLVWLLTQLDSLLFFQSGYLLMLKARVNKTLPNGPDA